jgi:predicted DNA-binding transcriptional regulator YafY
MPANRNALIRYQTIDKCLTNRYRLWTLEDLIEACSNALYEYEGIDKGVSRRTVQADMQIMRSDKLGYNAPIEVYDNKYYRYADANYSITNIPLTEQDLNTLMEITEILRQFKGFAHFSELSGIVQRLEDKIYTEKTQQPAIIDIERNENLKGLQFLDVLYNAILKQKVLTVSYQSFTARKPADISFHPYLLKEYNNRWFVLGKKSANKHLLTLALDRIHAVDENEHVAYHKDPNFNSTEYYKDTIGVTVINDIPQKVRLLFDSSNAPYVVTKPLHHSQKLLTTSENGIEVEITVIPNYELERVILGFGDSVTVLSPSSLKRRIVSKLRKSLRKYDSSL